MTASSPTPTLSIVVATGTIAGNREACLDAVARQRLPSGDIEILEQPIDGDLGRAWNLGAARAESDTLLFVRDDILLGTGAAARYRAAAHESPRDLAVGDVRLAAAAPGLIGSYVEHVLGAATFADCCGRAMAMRRELFDAVGGFGTGLPWGTEADFAFRVSQRGRATIHLPDVNDSALLPRTVRQVAALLDREGRGSVELYRRHAELLPLLKLGTFSAAGEGALALRRLLLSLGAPAALLDRAGIAFGARERRTAWHRFVRDYLYWRGVKAALRGSDLWQRLAHGPVILMYHAIGTRDERPGCYVVPIDRFERQLDWLTRAGYHVSSVDELLRCRREHRLPPARSVAITFDDGYRDNWTLATPALARRHLTATFFLVTGALGDANRWDQAGELAGRPLLSRDEIRAMLSSGMTVGAHTRTHPALPELAPDAVRAEVAGSREDLERELGVPVTAFAYPFGRLDASTSEVVARAGYVGACCSRSGINDPSVPTFLLRRLEVRGTDSLAWFARAVRRGRGRRHNRGR